MQLWTLRKRGSLPRHRAAGRGGWAAPIKKIVSSARAVLRASMACEDVGELADVRNGGVRGDSVEALGVFHAERSAP
jgi:hypothetical protein